MSTSGATTNSLYEILKYQLTAFLAWELASPVEEPQESVAEVKSSTQSSMPLGISLTTVTLEASETSAGRVELDLTKGVRSQLLHLEE